MDKEEMMALAQRIEAQLSTGVTHLTDVAASTDEPNVVYAHDEATGHDIQLVIELI